MVKPARGGQAGTGRGVTVLVLDYSRSKALPNTSDVEDGGGGEQWLLLLLKHGFLLPECHLHSENTILNK